MRVTFQFFQSEKLDLVCCHFNCINANFFGQIADDRIARYGKPKTSCRPFVVEIYSVAILYHSNLYVIGKELLDVEDRASGIGEHEVALVGNQLLVRRNLKVIPYSVVDGMSYRNPRVTVPF